MNIIISLIVIASIAAVVFFVVKKKAEKPTPTQEDSYAEKAMVNPPGGKEEF